MAARKFSALQVQNAADDYYSESEKYSEYSSEYTASGSAGYGYGSAENVPEYEQQPSGYGYGEELYGEDAAAPEYGYGNGYGYSSVQTRATETNTCPDCETFKVVQLNSDPADPQNCGVIGYVYTYSIRKRHRTIKRAVCPKCPTKIVYVKDPPDRSADVERRLKAADENIAFAERQLERFKNDLRLAKQMKKEAEEERFKLEEKRLGGRRGTVTNTATTSAYAGAEYSLPASSAFDDSGSKKGGSYGSYSSSYGNAIGAKGSKKGKGSASYSGGSGGSYSY